MCLVEAYPREDTRVALELVNHELQLACKLLLLSRVGLPLRHRRHVLDDQESELVGGAVEEAGLDFDLEQSVSNSRKRCGRRKHTCFRTMLNPNSLRTLRS